MTYRELAERLAAHDDVESTAGEALVRGLEAALREELRHYTLLWDDPHTNPYGRHDP